NRSSSLLVRRPLTPQTGSSLFSVHADGYRHQSPDSPTLHLDHRYNRRYPQPLTPSRSSTTLSIDNGIVSDGPSSSTEDADVASTSAGSSSSSGHLTGIARQSLRHHAASVSVSAAESQVLMPSNGHSSNVPHQQQQPETEQQQQQQQDFRGRTSSESELGQFDGPASTHLSSLPLPPGSSATNTTNVCGGGRSSTAAHYDVLGIVMESEQHHFAESSRYLGKMGETVEQAGGQQADKLTMLWFKKGATAEARKEVENTIIENGGTVEKRMENLGAIGVKLGNVHAENTTSLTQEHDAINFMEEDSTVTTQ
ncbi:hypothetical protein GGI23_001167, partial [Coemansia sp. RSA 2559]